MNEQKSLLEFPTKFPIKIFGLDDTAFISSIKATIREHVIIEDQLSWQQKLSKKGTYLAVTVTIMARDKQQLDAIYMDLTKNINVKMAL